MGAKVAMPTGERDDGFSLVELLVVVVIISLLAAIAVPLFLAQRERAWVAQSETSLKNAATAMEAAAVGNNGVYSGITIESANDAGYCLSVLHRRSGDTFYWDSAVGKASDVNCRVAYR